MALDAGDLASAAPTGAAVDGNVSLPPWGALVLTSG